MDVSDSHPSAALAVSTPISLLSLTPHCIHASQKISIVPPANPLLGIITDGSFLSIAYTYELAGLPTQNQRLAAFWSASKIELCNDLNDGGSKV